MGVCEIWTCVCAHTHAGQKLILGVILHCCSPACLLGTEFCWRAGQRALSTLFPLRSPSSSNPTVPGFQVGCHAYEALMLTLETQTPVLKPEYQFARPLGVEV